MSNRPLLAVVAPDKRGQAADPYTWRRLIRRCAGLSSSTKLVAAMLADYADPDGTRAHPGNTRLATVTGLSPASVKRALAALRDLRLVEQVSAASGAGRGLAGQRGQTAEYRLTLPDLAWLAARTQLLNPDEKPDSPDVTPVDRREKRAHRDPPLTAQGVENPDRRVSPAVKEGSLTQKEGSPGPEKRAHREPPPNQRPNHLPNQTQPRSSPYVAELEGGTPRRRAVDNQVAEQGRSPPLTLARRRAQPATHPPTRQEATPHDRHDHRRRPGGRAGRPVRRVGDPRADGPSAARRAPHRG